PGESEGGWGRHARRFGGGQPLVHIGRQLRGGGAAHVKVAEGVGRYLVPGFEQAARLVTEIPGRVALHGAVGVVAVPGVGEPPCPWSGPRRPWHSPNRKRRPALPGRRWGAARCRRRPAITSDFAGIAN